MCKKRIPRQIEHLVSNTVKHYLNSKESLQRLVDMTNWVKGRCGDYVFQTSHGTQQIKLYEPQKYKNHINTPLRKRVREIMKLANEDPTPSLKEKLRYLFRTYPYYLKKEQPIKLKLKNFYFTEPVREGATLLIYKMEPEGFKDLENDFLYDVVPYYPDQTIEFSYQGEEEEWFYGRINGTYVLSNVLRFYWR
jgi:hypothetical protein